MEWQFPSFGILSTFLLFTFLLLQIYKKSKATHISAETNSPPGPKALPIIGNIHQMGGAPSLLHRFRQLADRYGPVMKLQIGEAPVIVISSPEVAKQVLKTHEMNFDERPKFLAGNVYFYNYRDLVFSPYGDYWRTLRKIITMELLCPMRVRSFRAIREEEVSSLIRTIYAKEGSTINLSKILFTFIYSIITRVSVGRKCKNEKEFGIIVKDFSKIGEELSIAAGGVNLVDLFPTRKLLHMFSWRKFRLRREHKKVDRILDRMIEERKGNKAYQIEKEIGENEVEDLLDVLLSLQVKAGFNFPVTDESIKALILDFFNGGGDTTLTLIEWAISELLRHPKAMEKAQKEVRALFNEIGYIDESCIHKLEYLKLIMKETLRLHPPISIIPRKCKVNCKINGYDLQANTKMLINAWMIGRDPKYWTEPEKFYPERFLDSSIDYKGTNFQFLPFGSGRRMCPGFSFGTAILELPLAELLLHFDWKIPNEIRPEDFDMSEIFGATVMRKHPLVLTPVSCYPPITK